MIIAADTQVDKTRFAGKRIYEASTKAAICDGATWCALRLPKPGAWAVGRRCWHRTAGPAGQGPAGRNPTGAYKHLMTGVSYMIPFVVAGGLLIAISFALGGINVFEDANQGTLAGPCSRIGAKAGFTLMVPILAGFIACSIADWPGHRPGHDRRHDRQYHRLGFLGGIAAGFIAGYVVKFLSDHIPLPHPGRPETGVDPAAGTETSFDIHLKSALHFHLFPNRF